MDTAERLEEITYRKKLELAYHTLGKVQPTAAAVFESANLINAAKSRCLLLVLPLIVTVDKHFKLAWEGATKQTGYVWDDILTPPQKGTKGVSLQTTGLQTLCHGPPETHRKGPMAHGKSGS